MRFEGTRDPSPTTTTRGLSGTKLLRERRKAVEDRQSA